MKNSGGRAGAISVALLLKEFTESYPWVHLDIAGTAYSETDLVTLPERTDRSAGRNVRGVRTRRAS